jgi:hypothetical protein
MGENISLEALIQNMESLQRESNELLRNLRHEIVEQTRCLKETESYLAGLTVDSKKIISEITVTNEYLQNFFVEASEQTKWIKSLNTYVSGVKNFVDSRTYVDEEDNWQKNITDTQISMVIQSLKKIESLLSEK